MTFLLISLLVSAASCYLAAALQSSGIKDRRIGGLRALSMVLPFWVISSAVVSLAGQEYKVAVYLVKVAFVIIVPTMTFWFVLNFTEMKIARSRPFLHAVVGITALDILLLLTGPWHGLYFLDYGGLPLPWGPIFIIHFATQICAVLAIYVLLLRYIVINYRSRPFLALTGVGAIIPAVLNVMYLLGVFDVDYDVSSLGYFFTIIAFAYVSYYRRLRRSKPGMLGDTLARIAKSQAISGGAIVDAARLISKESCIAIGAFRVRVWNYDAQAHTLKCIASYNNAIGQFADQEDYDMHGVPSFDDSIASDRIVAIDDTMETSRMIGEQNVFDPDVCAVLFAPVRIDSNPIGVVCVEQDSCPDFPDRREWSAEEQTFVSSLADLMAIAISNAERQSLTQQLREELSYRKDILLAVNSAATTLLGAPDGSFEASLYQGMKAMAETVGADRMYIWKNHTVDGELCCTQVYEWSETAEPQQGNEFTVSIPYSANLDLLRTLSAGDCINGVVREMPSFYRKLLEPQGIVSVLLVPVFINSEFWGFVGFDDCRKERVFTEQEEAILRSASLLFANAYQRNAMTEELVAAKESAERSNRYKTDFLARVSHEIRTPMNAIVGMTELSLRDNSLDSIKERLLTVKQSGVTLQGIISDILDFSRIEAGKMKITPCDYLLPALISDVASIIRVSVADTELLDFTVEIDGSLPEVLRGDENRIRQVLLNVLSNAVKYTDEGFIRLGVHASGQEGPAPSAITLVFVVSDSGIGIRPEDIGKIFADFTRLDQDRNREVIGIGLGLAITKNIVEAMGGDIKVESEFGRGSTFTITIPQERGSIDALSKGEFAPSFTAPGARVLVVDDIRSNLKVAEGLLEPYNMRIDLCPGGLEAVEAERSGRYDLIFMDHKMPKVDGIEATRRIRESGSDTPIVALTANAVTGVREMFLSHGFNDFLSKPIDTAKLDAILARWVPAERKS